MSARTRNKAKQAGRKQVGKKGAGKKRSGNKPATKGKRAGRKRAGRKKSRRKGAARRRFEGKPRAVGKKSLRKARRVRRRAKTPRKCRTSFGTQFQALMAWLLPGNGIFSSIKRHGNAAWTPVALFWMAILWSWSPLPHVTDAFVEAHARCRALGLEVHNTYQGMMGALVASSRPMLDVVWGVLHARMEQIGGEHWRIGGWVLIAFDGSRSSAPRTKSAERAFCAPNFGRGRTAKYRNKLRKAKKRSQRSKNPPQPQEPQLWITMMWHMGLRLPWMWKLGPSNSSERAHVIEMLESGHFPFSTLFCGDAGFVGYPLWSAILERGHQFLVRVGANVSVLAEHGCRIDTDGSVICWPEAVMKAGGKPLRLRLTRVKIKNTTMWMMTSVLDPKELSRAEIARYYRMRWGVEVEFRGLKQTLDRGELRCRNDKRLLAELDWSILGMTVAELFALKEQLRRGGRRNAQRIAPAKRSLAGTMRALRACLTNLREHPEEGKDLATRLRQATTDDYERKSKKGSRYRRRNPDKKPLGAPRVRKMTAAQRKKLAAMESQKNTA